MMIVMKSTATEQEIQAVIDRIESCGAHAHPSRGEEVTVIGAIGDREHVARLGLEGAPGVEKVVPILKPYKLSSRQLKGEARTVLDVAGRKIGGDHFTLIAGPCTVESRDQTLDDRARRLGRRRLAVPRRRLQAPLLAVLLPGPRPGGPAAALRGARRDRAADRHRADGRPRRRGGPRGRRRHPGRRAQHAELPAAGRDRPLGAPGADQARPLLDARGAADGGGVRPQGGQPERDAVRARHPHLRAELPLHARPHRRAGPQGALAPAGDRRPEPRRRATLAGRAAVAGRGGGGRRRDHRRGAPGARARRSATGRRRCTPTSFAAYAEKVEAAAAVAGKVLSSTPA